MAGCYSSILGTARNFVAALIFQKLSQVLRGSCWPV